LESESKDQEEGKGILEEAGEMRDLREEMLRLSGKI